MDETRQIKLMADAVDRARLKAIDTTNSMNYGFGGWYAKELYAEGYRDASIIAEELLEMAECYGAGVLFWRKVKQFAIELKKNCTEEPNVNNNH